VDHDVARLDRLRDAFEDAVELFGLGDHAPGKGEKK
jgi:hypothetical protein